MSFRYYYDRLTANEKRIYDDLYAGVSRCADKIKTIGVPNPKEVMGHVFSAIMADNPMLYYVDQTKIAYSYSSRDMEIEPTYHFSVRQINEYNRMIQDKAKRIINEIIRTAGADEIKRETALFEYFVKHYKYDTAALGSRDSFVSCKAHSLLGVFLEGKAVCEGFAEAFHYLLSQMGIECIRVAGYADWNYSSGHAWNIVKLKRKYYHVDVTWAVSRNESGLIWYDYLNVSDKEISIDHGGFSGLPRCIWEDLDYYKREGLEIGSKTILKDKIKECLIQRHKELSFRLVKGRGREGISNPGDGLNLIRDMTTEAHRECNGPSISYVTSYNDKKNTFIIRFTYR